MGQVVRRGGVLGRDVLKVERDTFALIAFGSLFHHREIWITTALCVGKAGPHVPDRSLLPLPLGERQGTTWTNLCWRDK